MRDKINYEFQKQASHFKSLFWTNIVVNFISLVFFTLVGRLDETSKELSILNYAIGVITLATTVTVTVAIIFGVVLFNRLLLIHYIKQEREITYLFPEGRSTIFLSKLYGLCANFLISFFPVVLLENIIYYFLCEFFGFMIPDSFGSYFKVIYIVGFSALFSIDLILISFLIGQKFQATNISIISSVIMVSIVGNFIAFLYRIPSIIIILLILISLIAVLIAIKFLVHKIRRDDVMES